MTDADLLHDIMQTLHVSLEEARVILTDARARFHTDTELDRVRYQKFVSRLPAYRRAMRFA